MQKSSEQINAVTISQTGFHTIFIIQNPTFSGGNHEINFRNIPIGSRKIEKQKFVYPKIKNKSFV